MIVSHDFTDFGWDLRRKNPEAVENPLELLKALDKVEGIDWIRPMYLYPDGITLEMIEFIRASQKIVKYFDMPLQHINDAMLKRMNRKMTRSEIETVLENIRTLIPEAVIRTQFIVGFPGETPENFEELLHFVSEQKFDRVGCFQYSPEENTPGGKMQDQVSDEVKKFRHDALMEVQQNISRQKNKTLVGRTIDVVVEGPSEETELLLQGRYWGQAPDIDGVVLINEGEAQVGQVVRVKVTQALEYDLLGKIVR